MLLMCEPPSRLGVRRTGTNCEEGLHSKRIVTHRLQQVRDDSFTKQRGPGMGRAESTASVQRKGGAFPSGHMLLYYCSFCHEYTTFLCAEGYVSY